MCIVHRGRGETCLTFNRRASAWTNWSAACEFLLTSLLTLLHFKSEHEQASHFQIPVVDGDGATLVLVCFSNFPFYPFRPLVTNHCRHTCAFPSPTTNPHTPWIEASLIPKQSEEPIISSLHLCLGVLLPGVCSHAKTPSSRPFCQNLVAWKQ